MLLMKKVLKQLLNILLKCQVCFPKLVVSCLIHLELDPGFFKPVVVVVVSAMLKISAAKQLQDATRQLALEFLISLVENKPSMCRAIDGFPKSMVDILLQWMLEIPEESLDDWNTTQEGAEDLGDVDNSVIAQVYSPWRLVSLFSDITFVF